VVSQKLRNSYLEDRKWYSKPTHPTHRIRNQKQWQ